MSAYAAQVIDLNQYRANRQTGTPEWPATFYGPQLWFGMWIFVPVYFYTS